MIRIKLPGVINVTALITFGDDYREGDTPYNRLAEIDREYARRRA